MTHIAESYFFVEKVITENESCSKCRGRQLFFTGENKIGFCYSPYDTYIN